MSDARQCEHCGEANPPRARFCLGCGSELAAPTAPRRQVRKTVTILFSDVTGSTELGERLDAEALRRVMGRYFEEMRAVLERHGGTVEKFIGDAIMAVFGIPVAHEDDALRAVRAAVEMRDALADLNDDLERRHAVRLRIRTGINTGEVVAGEAGAGEHLVTGDPVNVAARLEQAAGSDEILLGQLTFGLVRDAVEVAGQPLSLELKGKGAPVAAHRLVAVRKGGDAVTRRLEAALVGRQQELTALSQALERAISQRTCQLFTVLGSAGVGKSRLVYELLTSAGGRARIIRGRCLPYGRGITFWPLAEALKGIAGISDADDGARAAARLEALLAAHGEHDSRVAERLSMALGFSDGLAPAEELAWAARRAFEALARDEPLVCVFDDLHWAEPTFLDLLEHVVDWSREAPILLLCIARPELLEARPGWGGGKVNATMILLEGLPDTDSLALVGQLLGPGEGQRRLARRIVEAAEGNPLFVEQMVGMLVDDGVLVARDGRYEVTVPVERVRIPPSVSALLQARLDRLTDGERDVLGRAAVVGKEFQRSAVQELSPLAARDDVPGRLLHLVRKELIRPQRAPEPGDDLFRFRHLLIRDTAYAALPKEERADLHERFARWLVAWAGPRLAEYEEIVAFHLEQAYQYLIEIAPADARTEELAREAAALFREAGRRATGRNDTAAATELLGRAAALLPEESQQRLDLLVELAQLAFYVGELVRANTLLEEVLAVASRSGNERSQALAHVMASELRMFTDPAVDVREVEALIARAEPAIVGAGDAWAMLRLIDAQIGLSTMRCAWGEAEAAAARGYDIAMRAGDRLMAAGMARSQANGMHWGATPADVALTRVEALADELEGQGMTLFLPEIRAPLYAMQGRFDEARSEYRAAQRHFEEMGMVSRLAFSGLRAWDSERIAGDHAAAEREARAGVERAGAFNETSVRSTMAAMLADSLVELGRMEEATASARLADELGSPSDLATQIMLRTVRARISARQGRIEDAGALVRDALRLAEPTDFLLLQARAHEALAEVELARDRHQAAATALGDALLLYERKHDLSDAARVRAVIASLAADATQAPGS